MKKTNLINSEVSCAIASLRHTDMLVFAAAGLPIPPGARKIDIALTKGIPTFSDTLRVVLEEMYIEKALVSEDIKTVSLRIYEVLFAQLGIVLIEAISHEMFKNLTSSAKAIIRTGVYTP